MLTRLVQIASLRWFKAAVAVLWLLSFVSIFKWVRHSREVTDGGFIERWNYIAIHRTALFVWFTLILLAYAAYHFKKRSLGYYGLVEITIGLVGGFVAVQRIPIDDPASWFALAASAYVMVRGAGNVASAVPSETDLKSNAPAVTVPNMSSIRTMNTPLAEQTRKAAEELGAEPLEGSGCEGETPDPDFSENAPSAPSPRQ